MASSRLFRYDVRHFAAMRMLAEVSLVLGIYHVGTRSRQLRAWNGRRFPIFSRSPSKRSSNPGKRKAHRSRRRPRGYAAPASLTRSGFVFFDGGHIDNLGAYELLRRRCRLFRRTNVLRSPMTMWHSTGRLTLDDSAITITVLNFQPGAATGSLMGQPAQPSPAWVRAMSQRWH